LEKIKKEARKMPRQKQIHLYQATFTYSRLSEYEHQQHEIFIETTQKKAEKAAIFWLHELGYRWSDEDSCYFNKELGFGHIEAYVRFEVQEYRYLRTANGPSIDLATLVTSINMRWPEFLKSSKTII
jgi:hypothetical protein